MTVFETSTKPSDVVAMTGLTAVAADLRSPESLAARLLAGLRARAARSIASGTICRVTLVLVSLVAVLVAGAAIYIFTEAETALARRANTVATIVSSAAANPVWDFDQATVRAMLESLNNEPDIVSAEVLDDQGRILADHGAPTRDRRQNFETVLIKQILLEREGVLRTIGSLRLVYTAALVRDAAWREVAALILAGILSTLGMAICLAHVLRRLTVPLAGLTAVMEALQRGRYDDAVVPATGRVDELGAMARSLNGTLNELRFLNGELETRNQRFDAALHTMPQGLCMLDAERRVIVYNNRFLDLFSLCKADVDQAPTWQHVVSQIAEKIEFSDEDLQHLHELGEPSVGRPDGSVVLRSVPTGRFISISHRSTASSIMVGTFEDVSERQRAEMRIAHMARHDALTNLPNRVLLRERLEDALRDPDPDGEAIAVLCLDLDRFKAVNDTLGHSAGDALLVGVAKRIRGELRASETVARLGGDEFAILLPTGGSSGAEALAQRLVASMNAPYTVEGSQANVGVSIGIALASRHAAAPDELLKQADLALYQAKADGRGTFCFFKPDMDARVEARRLLEHDLRQALAQCEFEVHYQPLVDVKSGRVTCVEALLRWNHPCRGIVSPAEFIPLAEETGLIVPIGSWVLQEACRQAAAWEDGQIKVAVNVSSLQFKSHNLLKVVEDALIASGLMPSRLEIEITESVFLSDGEGTLATLHSLRKLGVQIAMDDFGTGYSSLSYLRTFHFDKIKIDQSFIRELGRNTGCDAIIVAVATLGAELGITTTAEGVETLEQFDRVRAAGYVEVQGFLVSRPKPVLELVRWLAQQHGQSLVDRWTMPAA